MSDILGLEGIERALGCLAALLLLIGATVGLIVGYLIWGGA
jgi:hypothetical protein